MHYSSSLTQIDVCPEELHNSVPASVAIQVFYSNQSWMTILDIFMKVKMMRYVSQGRPWTHSISPERRPWRLESLKFFALVETPQVETMVMAKSTILWLNFIFSMLKGSLCKECGLHERVVRGLEPAFELLCCFCKGDLTNPSLQSA